VKKKTTKRALQARVRYLERRLRTLAAYAKKLNEEAKRHHEFNEIMYGAP
jgi:hypothetical protein